MFKALGGMVFYNITNEILMSIKQGNLLIRYSYFRSVAIQTSKVPHPPNIFYSIFLLFQPTILFRGEYFEM